MINVGDILSTVGVFSTVGGNHEYRGGCSVPWGTQITKDFSPQNGGMGPIAYTTWPIRAKLYTDKWRVFFTIFSHCILLLIISWFYVFRVNIKETLFDMFSKTNKQIQPSSFRLA